MSNTNRTGQLYCPGPRTRVKKGNMFQDLTHEVPAGKDKDSHQAPDQHLSSGKADFLRRSCTLRKIFRAPHTARTRDRSAYSEDCLRQCSQIRRRRRSKKCGSIVSDTRQVINRASKCKYAITLASDVSITSELSAPVHRGSNSSYTKNSGSVSRQKGLQPVPRSAPRDTMIRGKFTFTKGIRIRDYELPRTPSHPVVLDDAAFRCRDGFSKGETSLGYPQVMTKVPRC